MNESGSELFDSMFGNRHQAESDAPGPPQADDGPFAAFLRGEWLDVSSSNVASARYDADTQSLIIRYLSGDTWEYSPISEAEALSFATAPSHGRWIWDNVKVRGTRNQHVKSARKL